MNGSHSQASEISVIWVEQSLPGFHNWPDAPPERDFLAHRHRHVFRVRAEILVKHDERDFEFFDVADRILAWWGPGEHEFGSASCEAMARELGLHLIRSGLPVTETSVAISEEGGSRVIWRDISTSP
ncbi:MULTISPECIES: hypothetical protein [unclassified Streptomyces]|uniref:hypothetical protein n=1 Tax=unclassified Streptomyces TaxID=2593676 RepID=UPI0011CDFFDD|nr:hypothetical protein [Streptomyces sp. I6]